MTAGVSQSPGRRGQGPPAQGPAGLQAGTQPEAEPGHHSPRVHGKAMSPAPSPLQGGSVPLLSSATYQTPTTVTSPAAGNHGSASWCEAGAAFLNILGTCPLGWLLWGTNAAPRCPLGWHFCTRAVKGPATACSRDTPGSVYTSACPRCMAQAGRSGAALCPTCSIPRGSPVPAGIPGVTGGGGPRSPPPSKLLFSGLAWDPSCLLLPGLLLPTCHTWAAPPFQRFPLQLAELTPRSSGLIGKASQTQERAAPICLACSTIEP